MATGGPASFREDLGPEDATAFQAYLRDRYGMQEEDVFRPGPGIGSEGETVDPPTTTRTDQGIGVGTSGTEPRRGPFSEFDHQAINYMKNMQADADDIREYGTNMRFLKSLMTTFVERLQEVSDKCDLLRSREEEAVRVLTAVTTTAENYHTMIKLIEGLAAANSDFEERLRKLESRKIPDGGEVEDRLKKLEAKKVLEGKATPKVTLIDGEPRKVTFTEDTDEPTTPRKAVPDVTTGVASAGMAATMGTASMPAFPVAPAPAYMPASTSAFGAPGTANGASPFSFYSVGLTSPYVQSPYAMNGGMTGAYSGYPPTPSVMTTGRRMTDPAGTAISPHTIDMIQHHVPGGLKYIPKSKEEKSKITNAVANTVTAKIPEFTGAEDVETWIRDFIGIIGELNWDDAQVRTVLFSKLKGSAEEWYKKVRVFLRSSAEVLLAMGQQFRDESLEAKMRSELRDIEWQAGESLDTYYNRLERLVQRVMPDISMKSLIEMFIAGLPRKLRARMIGLELKPATIEEAMQIAKKKQYAIEQEGDLPGHMVTTKGKKAVTFTTETAAVDTDNDDMEEAQAETCVVSQGRGGGGGQRPQSGGQRPQSPRRNSYDRPPNKYVNDKPVCNKCEDPSHFMRDCPHRKNGMDWCTRCLKPGHWIKKCFVQIAEDKAKEEAGKAKCDKSQTQAK
jgi:hypothetical protein